MELPRSEAASTLKLKVDEERARVFRLTPKRFNVLFIDLAGAFRTRIDHVENVTLRERLGRWC